MATRTETLTARLTKIQTRLTNYYAAEEALLGGAQSYSIGNRTLTRADLDSLREQIDYLEKQELKLINSRNGAIRVQRVVPRDI